MVSRKSRPKARSKCHTAPRADKNRKRDVQAWITRCVRELLQEPKGEVVALTGPAVRQNVGAYADILGDEHRFHAIEYHLITYMLMQSDLGLEPSHVMSITAKMLDHPGPIHLFHGHLLEYVLAMPDLSNLKLLDYDSPESQFSTIMNDNFQPIVRLSQRPDILAGNGFGISVTSALRGPGGHRQADSAARIMRAIWMDAGYSVVHKVYERFDSHNGIFRRGYADNRAQCRTEFFAIGE